MNTSAVQEPLRFGLIGCGRVVRELHLPAWKQVRGAKLVAVCDGSPEALAAFGHLQPAVRQYRQVEDLLAHSDDLDFVVLATPGRSHPEIATQILTRGLHLLCEKPLALEMASAARLFATARNNAVMLTAVHNYRFRDNSIKALRSIRSRELGDIVAVNLCFHTGSLFDEPVTWMRQEREHRILLFDFAYHFVDLALLFLDPSTSLRFVDSEEDNLGLRHVVFGIADKNGARGLFELMLDSSCARTAIEVLGEDRGFVLDFFPAGFRLLPHRDTPFHRGIADFRRLGAYVRGRLREAIFSSVPQNSIPHARLFGTFLEAVRTGGPNPVEEDGVVRTLTLLEAVARRAYHRVEYGELEAPNARPEFQSLG